MKVYLPNRGFTIMEIVIAIGIFILLIQIVTTLYGRFVGTQRLGIGQQEMQEDIRLFLQLFSREARTAFGNTYKATASPPGIVFRNQENQCVHYRYDDVKKIIERADATPPDRDADCADPNIYTSGFRTLTDSKNTVVEQLTFVPEPATPTFAPSLPSHPPLQTQGFITVYVSVRPAADATQIMNLQSTVTSRQITPYIP